MYRIGRLRFLPPLPLFTFLRRSKDTCFVVGVEFRRHVSAPFLLHPTPLLAVSHIPGDMFWSASVCFIISPSKHIPSRTPFCRFANCRQYREKGTRKELQQKEWIKWRPEEGCFLHHSSVASAAQFVVELSGEKETDRSPADAKWEMESILRCIFFFSLARYIGRERKIPSSLH